MSNESRRKLLKSIAAGGGAIVAGKSLPESWSKPVVDTVMLPVHAQTSLMQFTSGGQTIMSAVPVKDSIFASVANKLVPEAQADCTYTAEACIADNGDGTVKVDAIIEDCSGNAGQLSANAPVAGDPVVMALDMDCNDAAGLLDQLGLVKNAHASPFYYDDVFVQVDSVNGNVVGRFITAGPTLEFDLPSGECGKPPCPTGG